MESSTLALVLVIIRLDSPFEGFLEGSCFSPSSWAASKPMETKIMRNLIAAFLLGVFLTSTPIVAFVLFALPVMVHGECANRWPHGCTNQEFAANYDWWAITFHQRAEEYRHKP